MDYGIKDYINTWLNGREPEFSEIYWQPAVPVGANLVATKNYQNDNVSLIYIRTLIIAMGIPTAPAPLVPIIFQDYLGREIFQIQPLAYMFGSFDMPLIQIPSYTLLVTAVNATPTLSFSIGYQWVREKLERHDKK